MLKHKIVKLIIITQINQQHALALLAILLESQSNPSYRPSPDVAQVLCIYLKQIISALNKLYALNNDKLRQLIDIQTCLNSPPGTPHNKQSLWNLNINVKWCCINSTCCKALKIGKSMDSKRKRCSAMELLYFKIQVDHQPPDLVLEMISNTIYSQTTEIVC